MSGRPAPASEVILDCTSKSTRSIRPAASTTLRSWVSPQTPRVLLARRADASDSAVLRSRSSDSVADRSCWLSSPCCRLRWASSSATFCCMSCRLSLTGARACSTLLSCLCCSVRASWSLRWRSLSSRYWRPASTTCPRRASDVAWTEASSSRRLAWMPASRACISARATWCRASRTRGSVPDEPPLRRSAARAARTTVSRVPSRAPTTRPRRRLNQEFILLLCQCPPTLPGPVPTGAALCPSGA